MKYFHFRIKYLWKLLKLAKAFLSIVFMVENSLFCRLLAAKDPRFAHKSKTENHIIFTRIYILKIKRLVFSNKLFMWHIHKTKSHCIVVSYTVIVTIVSRKKRRNHLANGLLQLHKYVVTGLRWCGSQHLLWKYIKKTDAIIQVQ